MEEKPKGIPQPPEQANPCPICGGTKYLWGNTVSDSPGGRVFFRPDGGWWGEGRQLRARRCEVCGNIQFFTE